MITLPREIIIGTLANYLTHKEILNLSSVNVQLRLLLGSHAFPYFKNAVDPDHTSWKYCNRFIQQDGTLYPITLLPSAAPEMKVYIGQMALGEFGLTPASIASSTFFGNLTHLKIITDYTSIPDPEIWASISLDSLISLEIPLCLDAEGTLEYSFMSNACKSLIRGGGKNLRTLILTDHDFTNDQLNKYTLGPEILNLISSDLLPGLSTFRFPLALEYNGERQPRPYDRSPLLCQLLTASANHATANLRSTPWRLGHSESNDRISVCITSTVRNCICLPMTPTVTYSEYESLVKTADRIESYMRLPEFFKPHLTVAFADLYSVRAAAAAASMTALTSVQLSFPPPLHTTLFGAITHLTLSLPEDRDDLAAYQPAITALPETFPRLSYLTLSLPRINPYEQYDCSIDVSFGGLVLPGLQLHTLDVSARAVATRCPCGHGRLRFGVVKAEWLRVRNMVSCMMCWDPLMGAGTKGVEVHGLLVVPDTEDTEEVMLDVLEELGQSGREVNVSEDYVQWD